MAYTEIVITRFGDHLVSMLLKDGHPVEFQCLSEKNKVDIGNIYIGVVKNVVKNINGAFVEFDQDEIGFLSMRHRQYKAGDEVLVQIKKEATEEERPMLSDQIELTGEYLVLTSDKLSVGISNKIHQKEKKQELKEMAETLVTQEYGFILRTEAAKADKEDVLYEADMLAEKYQQIVPKKMFLWKQISCLRNIMRSYLKGNTAKLLILLIQITMHWKCWFMILNQDRSIVL